MLPFNLALTITLTLIEGLFDYHIGTEAILCFVSVVIGFGPILVRAISAARYNMRPQSKPFLSSICDSEPLLAVMVW